MPWSVRTGLPALLAMLLLVSATIASAGCAPPPTAAPTKSSAPSTSQGAEGKPAAPAATSAPAAPAGATSAPAPAALTKPVAAATAAPAVKVKRGGILVNANSSAYNSLDPIYDNGGNNMMEVGLFESLLRYEVTDMKAGTSQIVPDLADSWQQADPKTIAIKLRKGVKFHDGSEMTADVVKWSLERMGSTPKSLSKRLAENIATVEVVDPSTLKITYKEQSALHALNLTMATGGTGGLGSAIISKAAMDKLGEDAFMVTPSATGPMKIKEWNRSDVLQTTRWEGYWKDGADGQKLPYLDGITARYMPDMAVQLMELKAGTIHTTRPAPADLPALKGNPSVEVLLMPWTPSSMQLGFNSKKEPFGTNLKLRQAAAHAIDQVSMAKVLGLDAGTTNYHFTWRPGWAGWDESLPKYEFSLDKSNALMKEAGFAGGADINILHYNSSTYRKEAEVLQQMWAKAGIRAVLDTAEMVAARAKTKAGEFEAHPWSMSPSPDAGHFNRMFLCDGAANWNNYCNPEMDKCMKEGERELDTAKRAEIYKRCQKIAYEDSQVVGMYQVAPVFAYSKQVKNFKIETRVMNMNEVWLDK